MSDTFNEFQKEMRNVLLIADGEIMQIWDLILFRILNNVSYIL